MSADAATAAAPAETPAAPAPKAFNSGSLYVGDLHPDVTETMLFEIFKTVGTVASIRVCRDAVTRRSLGYAYVNFHQAVDAERALDTMNYQPIRGRPCRIMWSHRDPSLRKSSVGNIFVKNLDKSVDNKALYDMFSAHGNILSCKVATNDAGDSLGYGFVHYETQEAAEQAIAKLNGTPVHDKPIFVGIFQARRDREGGDGSGEERKYTNIYVKNLDPAVSVDQLKTMFGKFGEITSATIMEANGSSRGFGFVNFNKPEEARAAVEAMNGKEQDNGKTLYCGRAQKKSERESELRHRFEALKMERIAKEAGVNLYIKNLDETIDDEKLRAEFSQFGSITSARVMKDDKTGLSKGFGFVCFTTPEEATKAVTEMNGRMLIGKPVYVALAQRKDVRRAQLETLHRAQANMARGFPAPGMYAMGQPMYYPAQGALPGGRGVPPAGFVYPGPGGAGMVPRPRWNAPPAQMGRGGYQQPIPNYVMPMQAGGGAPAAAPRGGRGGRGGAPQGAGGRGGAAGGRGGTVVGAGDGRYELKSGAVNVQQQPAQPQARPVMPVMMPTINPAMLAAVSPEDRKQFLGENLFPLIGAVQPNHAGKITGMLLESMDIPELLLLLENQQALFAKIGEAMHVLQQAEAAQATGGDE